MKQSVTARTVRVGVTARHGDADWVTKNTHHYLNVLSTIGADALVLSPDTPVVLPGRKKYVPDPAGRLDATVLDHVDGLILAGGGDVDPGYFGAELAGADPDTIDRMRDELELGLTRAALASDLPILGICRGCQVLNVAAGGGMVQHFDGHRSPADSTAYHDVSLVTGSWFHTTIGRSSMTVNTFHHQGVDRATLASTLRPSGYAWPDTWLIEAFESVSRHWVVGVQWHPERLFELDEDNRTLWTSFLQACRNHRHRRGTR